MPKQYAYIWYSWLHRLSPLLRITVLLSPLIGILVVWYLVSGVVLQRSIEWYKHELQQITRELAATTIVEQEIVGLQHELAKQYQQPSSANNPTATTLFLSALEENGFDILEFQQTGQDNHITVRIKLKSSAATYHRLFASLVHHQIPFSCKKIDNNYDKHHDTWQIQLEGTLPRAMNQ